LILIWLFFILVFLAFHTAKYILIVIWFFSVISIKLFYPQCDKLERETGESGAKVLWKDEWASHPSVCGETSTPGLQRGCTVWWSTSWENCQHGFPQARKKQTFEGNGKKVKMINLHIADNLVYFLLHFHSSTKCWHFRLHPPGWIRRTYYLAWCMCPGYWSFMFEQANCDY